MYSALPLFCFGCAIELDLTCDQPDYMDQRNLLHLASRARLLTQTNVVSPLSPDTDTGLATDVVHPSTPHPGTHMHAYIRIRILISATDVVSLPTPHPLSILEAQGRWVIEGDGTNLD